MKIFAYLASLFSLANTLRDLSSSGLTGLQSVPFPDRNSFESNYLPTYLQPHFPLFFQLANYSEKIRFVLIGGSRGWWYSDSIIPILHIFFVLLFDLFEFFDHLRARVSHLGVSIPAGYHELFEGLRAARGDGGSQPVLGGLDDDLEVKHKIFVFGVRCHVLASEYPRDNLPHYNRHRKDVGLGCVWLSHIHLKCVRCE